jgi:hypothetical protein
MAGAACMGKTMQAFVSRGLAAAFPSARRRPIFRVWELSPVFSRIPAGTGRPTFENLCLPKTRETAGFWNIADTVPKSRTNYRRSKKCWVRDGTTPSVPLKIRGFVDFCNLKLQDDRPGQAGGWAESVTRLCGELQGTSAITAPREPDTLSASQSRAQGRKAAGPGRPCRPSKF